MTLVYLFTLMTRAWGDGWEAYYEGTYHHLSYLTDRKSVFAASTPPGVGISAELHDGAADTFRYEGIKVSSSYEFEAEKTRFNIAAGVHTLNNFFENKDRFKEDIFFFDFKASWQTSEASSFTLRVGQDYTFHTWVDPTLARMRIAEKIAEAAVEASPGRWRLKLQGRRALLSDENVRFGYDGYALYEFSDEPVNMRLGVGVWEVAFRDRNWYWTPVEAIDLNARSEFEMWPADQWYVQAKFYTGVTNDLGRTKGQSSYQELRLNHTVGSITGSIYYVRFGAFTKQYTWWREDLGATLSIPL